MSRTRRLDLLLVSFILICTGTAAAQVPKPTPDAGATTTESRAVALRSLNSSTADDIVDIDADRNALRLAPNDAGLYNNLGYAYARQQNYDAAVRMFEQRAGAESRIILQSGRRPGPAVKEND